MYMAIKFANRFPRREKEFEQMSRMIPTRSYFLAAKKVACQTDFKMADMQVMQQSQQASAVLFLAC